MKTYVLSATYQGSTTSIPIKARDETMALVLSYGEIGKRYVADKRWDVGAIALIEQNDPGIKILEIPEIKPAG